MHFLGWWVKLPTSLLIFVSKSCDQFMGRSGFRRWGLYKRLLTIVGVGLPATQLISSQRSFMTGS